MGLLSKGTPLYWPDSIKYIEYVKEHGIIQFINSYKRLKDRANDKFLWGDEVEYIVFHFARDSNTVKISLRAFDIMEDINKRLKDIVDLPPVIFHPEYGRFMIEATPGRPYGGMTSDLRLVEANMKLRRSLIESQLTDEESILTVSAHPRMGCGEFTYPGGRPMGSIANSKFIPDNAINPHPRFGCLTRNIRTRRGSNVDIRMPLFQDENTAEQKEHPGEIYMDAMAFGMGCCCLQVTFQARSVNEARHLYDQLAVLSPILLALTAATPFLRGLIADTDVRWKVIAQSVDDRTPEERGLEPLKNNKYVINKSRYDSIDSYMSLEETFKDEYNDLDLVYNEAAYKMMTDEGIDDLLAKHIAHLFIRDPVCIFQELVELDDKRSTNHFENIQSTNWQTVRFKPPPEDSDIGWRVEFRSMEIQFTDYENAAFSVFIALISRAILFFKLNLYIPISKVDENMEIAHKRDASRTEKFYFRATLKSDGPDDYDMYTMNDIINGKGDEPGLIKVVATYLDAIKCDEETRQVIDGYLDLIKRRAAGELLTAAQWLRLFVKSHPDYKHDSEINDKVCRDVLKTIQKITHNEVQVPDLLNEYRTETANVYLSEEDAVGEPTVVLRVAQENNVAPYLEQLNA